jgi:tetratricopeptide (TPR) repeat protein
VLAGAFEKIEEWSNAENAYLLAMELDPNNEEIVCDYIEFLIDLERILDAKYFMENMEIPENLVLITDLIKVNLYWILNRKQEAIELLIMCIIEDEEKSKELFSLYPNLKNEQKIVDLFSN